MSKQKPIFIPIGDDCIRDPRIVIGDDGEHYFREWTPILNLKKKTNHEDTVALCQQCELLGGGWDAPEDPAVALTLIDYDRVGPAVHESAIQNTPESGWLWTKQILSESDASSSGYAWSVYVGNGGVGIYYRAGTGFARACRLVPPRQ